MTVDKSVIFHTQQIRLKNPTSTSYQVRSSNMIYQYKAPMTKGNWNLDRERACLKRPTLQGIGKQNPKSRSMSN